MKGVLLAELIVRFVVNTVTGNYLSAASHTLKRCYDLLGKQQTPSDIGHICGICKAWEDNLLANCRHGISNDLVLELDWEVGEGEYPIDLIFYVVSVPESGVIGRETNLEFGHCKGSEPVIVSNSRVASHCYVCFFGLGTIAMCHTPDSRNQNLPNEGQGTLRLRRCLG